MTAFATDAGVTHPVVDAATVSAFAAAVVKPGGKALSITPENRPGGSGAHRPGGGRRMCIRRGAEGRCNRLGRGRHRLPRVGPACRAPGADARPGRARGIWPGRARAPLAGRSGRLVQGRPAPSRGQCAVLPVERDPAWPGHAAAFSPPIGRAGSAGSLTRRRSIGPSPFSPPPRDTSCRSATPSWPSSRFGDTDAQYKRSGTVSRSVLTSALALAYVNAGHPYEKPFCDDLANPVNIAGDKYRSSGRRGGVAAAEVGRCPRQGQGQSSRPPSPAPGKSPHCRRWPGPWPLGLGGVEAGATDRAVYAALLHGRWP